MIDDSREVTAVGEIQASVFSGSCVECDPYGDLSLVVCRVKVIVVLVNGFGAAVVCRFHKDLAKEDTHIRSNELLNALLDSRTLR